MRFIFILSGLILSSFLAIAQPTNQASGIALIPISAAPTSMRFIWASGNGANRIVVIKDPAGVYTPVSGVASPTANADFSAGSNITTGGGTVKCVYNSNGAAVTVTNLVVGTVYRVEIYEYNGSAATTAFNVNVGTSGTPANPSRNPLIFTTFDITGNNAWVVPTGINNVVAQTWGAGGGGGGGSSGNNGGSGGGGGAYAADVTGVTQAASMNVTIGLGGVGGSVSPAVTTGAGGVSFFGPNTTAASAIVKAAGGSAGTTNSTSNGGNGGTTGASTGALKKSGGRGGAGENSSGGGGGSSGGTDVNAAGVNGTDGNDGNSGTGGSGGSVAGGGSGSAGQNNGVAGANPGGFVPGGGGGGSQDTDTNVGGPGGNGFAVLSYSQPINQNIVFASSISKIGGAAVTIVSSGSSNNDVWFAPAGTVTFAAGATMTTAVGNLTSINAPATAGNYVLYVVDAAGNASLPSTAVLTVDNTAPTITATAPAGSTFVGSSNVSYTLSENIVANAGSKVTWTRTGGTADGGSPHTYLLTGGELTSGAHTNIPLASVTLVNGAIYSVAFNAQDAAGNNATTVTNTSVTFDTGAPAAFTVGSVVTTGGTIVAGAWNSTNGGVDIQVPVDIGTLDPTVVGGNVQLRARVAAGVFANIGSPAPIAGGDRNTNKVVSLSAANITAIAGYAQGVVLEFTAVITDAAGNPTTGTQSVTTLTVDTVVPVFSATAPASSTNVVTSNVSYTLSEAIVASAVSKVTWTRTGGTADPGSAWTYLLTGGELASGVHSNIPLATVTPVDGTIYSVAFDGRDAAGNPAVTVTNTNVLFDATAPAAFTVGSVVTTVGTVVAGFWNSTNTGVNIQVPVDIGTLDPTVVGGNVQLRARVAAGVFANIGSPAPIAGGDRNTNKVVSLSAANITAIAGYAQGVSLEFTAVISDAAGNPTTGTQSVTTLTVDTVVPVITATSPATSAFVNVSNVSYTLSEAIVASAGSKVTWTRTSGTADPGSAWTYLLTGGELTIGAHANIPLASVVPVNGTVYSVAFDARDAAGNPAVTVTKTGVTFDTTPPVITLTAPANSISVITSNVSYTLSEAIVASAGSKVTWTQTGGSPDGGSPHTYLLTGGELTSGAHTNIPLASVTLVDGATYSVAFDAQDAAGNTAVTVTKTNVTYDISAPAAFTVGSVLTTGGTIVANFWNSTNSGVDVQVPVDIGNLDPTVVGGTIQLRARVAAGVYANIGAPYIIAGGDRNTTKTMSLVAANITAIAGYAQGVSLQFTAIITDVAGNPTTGTQSVTALSVDTVVPVISATAPANSISVNTTNVSYTLSEAIAATAGSVITWTQTGGVPVDAGSPHTYLLTGGELTSGAHTNIAIAIAAVDGVIYSIAFDAQDAAGNTAVTITKTNVTYDISAPAAFTVGGVVTTAGTVVANFWNSTNTGVNIQVPVDIGNLDPTIVGGTIQLRARIAAGVFANIGAPYTILGGDRNTTKTLALTSGNITAIAGYAQGVSLEFTAVITDIANNVTTGTQSATSLTVDTVAPVISATLPATSAFANSSNVSYTLSEAGAAVAGSKITWTKTGGVPADGASPHTYLLTGAELTGGAHSNIPLASVVLVDAVVYSVAFDLRDLAGNTAATITHTNITFDNTPPAVTGIIIGPAAPLTGIGTTNGTTAASIPFQVTFSEDVTGVDATDFVLSTTGSVTGNIASVTGGPQVYNVTVNTIVGTGTMRLDFFSNTTVKDLANNSTISSFNSGGGAATYTIVLPQPAAHVTGFNAVPGPDNFSINLTWSTDVASATAYAIRIKGQLDDDSNGAYIALSDGSQPAADGVFTDGNGLAYVGKGLFAYAVTGLLSGKTYDFEIIPYALSPFTSADNIDYRLDGSQPTKTTTVTTGSLSGITVNTVPVTTISSLQTTYNPAAVYSMSVALRDDFLGTGIDNARTRFTDIVIFAGPSNTVPNWSDVLAEAALFDLSENPGSPAITTTITANTIVFSGLPTGSNAMGALDDNEPKAYRMKVRLKSGLTNGANLTVDNQQFDFLINASSFTYQTATSQPSRFEATQSITSGPGKNIVTVAGTAFSFAPAAGGVQPAATAAPLTTLSISPVAAAVDANGNWDKDYASVNVNVTTTGLLPVLPTPLTATAGLVTFPGAFQYQNAGTGSANNGTLILTDGAVTGTSSNVTVTYSSTTSIQAGAFVEPLKFSSLNNGPSYLAVNQIFDFNVVEDNGALGDGSPTAINQVIITQGTGNDIPDWTQAITQAALFDGSTVIFATPNPTNITFVIPSGTLGFIGDNATKNYQLYILYKPAPGGSLPTTMDNLNLVFEVLESNLTLDPVSSKFNVGENENSGAGNIAVEVLATKVQFVASKNIGNPTLLSKDISIQQANPQVEAIDVNGNRDLDYNSTSVTVTDLTSPAIKGPRTMANLPAANSMVSGLLTFPGNFRMTSVGVDGAFGQLTVTTAPANNALGGTISYLPGGSFQVRAGNATTVNSGPVGPATISSIVNASPGTTVFTFNVNDDPGTTTALEDDGAPTLITSINITPRSPNNISNWSAVLGGAELTDGTNTIGGTVGVANILFNTTGALGTVADNSTKIYQLRIWLKPTLSAALAQTIDGASFGFEVFSGASGSFVTQKSGTVEAGTSILPTQGADSGTGNNVVSVVATQLSFIPSTVNGSASLNAPYPGSGGQLLVEAIDINGNRDLGFTAGNSTVQVLTNANTPSPSTMSNLPPTQFTSGLLTFPTAFSFTSGSNGEFVTLSMTAGFNSTCSTNYLATGICGTSSTITLLSSFESVLREDPAYIYQPTIAYAKYQATNIASADIVSGLDSYEIARLRLTDGDGTTPDLDGAATTLTDIQLKIANAGNVSMLGAIRKIAIYNSGVAGASELLEKAPSPLDISNGYVTFSGLSIVAPDNNAPNPATISVRVSFDNTAANIIDKTLLRVSVVGATLAGGSAFDNTPATNVAGFPGGYIAPAGKNLIDVIATKLDFTTQPSVSPPAYAGINEPVSWTAIVKAQDQYQLLDTDFNGPASLSASASPTGSFSFTSGVMSLAGLRYTTTGSGKITATSGALSSNTFTFINTIPNNSTPCTAVNVIHVISTLATGGVTTSTNLIGNTSNAVIFGVTFTAQGPIAGEPKLKKFIISFSNSISGILDSNPPRVFESNSPNFTVGLPNVTSLGALVTPASTSIVVDFATPRDLSAGPKSYFLVVDVDPAANGSTPSIQPSVTDNGYPSGTNANIVVTPTPGTTAVSNGSAGSVFTFASIFPPTIVSSNPARGQLNVAPNQASLAITFSVPVWTLDNKVQLYDQTAGTPPVDLAATDGFYAGGNVANLISPIHFSLPGNLTADHVYYVTIAPGSQATSKGIMDENGNVFQGISSPGTLYFKAASPNPPNLLSVFPIGPVGFTKSVAVNPQIVPGSISTTGATINASFDQHGTAYYLIVSSGSAQPTVPQIKGGPGYITPANIYAQGSFTISQIFPSPQPAFGIVSPTTPFVANQDYDVWMAADNDAPAGYTVTTGSHYGGLASQFAISGAGPTMSFHVNPDPTTITLNAPDIIVCDNSWQIMDAPIVISEGLPGQFQTSGSQSFNLVLPAGFQFDVTTTGGVPNFGNLQLVGTDFVPSSGSLGFIGNSILTVSFDNNNNVSVDRIIITGLRVISSIAANGPFLRLGGQALPTIADQTSFATITSYDAGVIGFTNSYYTSLASPPAAVVTSIPDNANPNTITLTPTTAAGGALFGPNSLNDYGPSTFNGQGVSINQLSLPGVTLDAPFNITITHTDNNGCISNNAIQYTVYNHNTALNITNNVLPGGTTIVTAPLNSYCATNTNFKVNQINRPAYNTLGHVRFLDYSALAPFYQIDATAEIPSGVPAQIISGPFWKTIIETKLVKQVLAPNPAGVTGHDVHVVGIFNFHDFYFDDAVIADANFLSGGNILDPYENFKSTIISAATGATLTYYTGGSLGFVDITGNFQSRTNSAVRVPRVQRVNFFLPAVPVVDVSRPSFVDINDSPNNPPNPITQNPGTLVYCAAGGLINITARPAPVAGTSTGTFELRDMAGVLIPGIPVGGFVDNTNGSASIDPFLFTNGFADIRIVYNFSDSKSPCSSSASQVIRITPNPVASFTTTAVLGPNVLNATSFCVGNQVNFNAADVTDPVNNPPSSITAAPVTTPATPANTILTYSWDFGDIFATSTNPGTSSAIAPSHTFNQAQPYTVKLNLTSNWGCPSIPFPLPTLPSVRPVAADKTKSVNVGGIPVVKTRFDGISTADTFNFFDNGSTVSNSSIATLDWDFNYPSASVFNVDAAGGTATHVFGSAGRVSYDMRVTSNLGCINSLYLQSKALGYSDPDNDKLRTIVVLPRAVAASGTVGYAEDFEANNGNWQVWYASNGNFPLTFPSLSTTATTPDPSWRYGAPDGPAPLPGGIPQPPNTVGIVNDLQITGTKYWKTSDPTTKRYRGNERSALYSPSLDLTALSTPMISLNSWSQLEPSDGVILEYSQDGLNVADPLKQWIVLGKVGDGVGWFSDKGVAAKPGAQIGNDFGWSNTGNNTGWIDSKHTLDEIASTGSGSLANRLGRVVFRFSLASAKQDNGLTVDGFGIDNVRIGERTRTILLESFANTSNTITTTPPTQYSEKTTADSLSYFPAKSSGAPTIGTQVIKVNYHLNFPANDPFNLDNPADPSSRALFYNIVSTPKSILDGHKDEFDRPFIAWSRQSYGTRSLQLAQATLTPTIVSAASGTVTISVKVDAVFDLPPNTILHVAVLETSVPLTSLTAAQKANVLTGETQFYNVLKRMLPTAAGTRFSTKFANGILKGTTGTFDNIIWTPDPGKLYAPNNDLAVVIFLQNESTKEVYQVSYTSGLSDPGVVTGMEPVLASDVRVYPVPANRELHVEMPGILANTAPLLMMDQTGRTALESSIPAGHSSKTLNVSDLSPGVYILQINVGNGNFTRKKVMIIHEGN